MRASAPSEPLAIWDPVESLPREQLRALQLERLRAVVTRVLERQPAVAAQLAAAGVSSADELRSLDDLSRLPFSLKSSLREKLPVRPDDGAARGAGATARVERHARQAHGGGLHARRPRQLDRVDGPLHDHRRRAAGDADPQRQQLRPVHRRPRLPSGRRADRRDRAPSVGRLQRAAGAAAARPRRPGAGLHPLVRAGDRAGGARRGHRAVRASARDRPVWRRALERRAARRDRGRAGPERDEPLRPLGDVRARGGRRVRDRPGRAARAGGPLPGGGDRPRQRRGAARGRGGRARVHHAAEGGAAAAALPDG